MNQIHNIRSQNFLIEVPVDNKVESKTAVINWIQLLEEPFYVAGISFKGNSDNDSYNGCDSEWILQKDSKAGLKAICCNLYWNKQQSDSIKESFVLSLED